MNAATLDQRFSEAMGQLLGPEFPENIALAVSGGGDSMAMLALAHNWARVWGPRLWVVTVDHGLRPESADEADMVAAFCSRLDRPHATLRWRWDGTGNLQNAARRARLELIDRWRGGIAHVLMAHTADDVAETFLIRLARGSGVEGLSAMATRRRVVLRHAGAPTHATDKVIRTERPPEPSDDDGTWNGNGFEILRPCLTMTRAELRHHARTLQVPWVEDPSNDDPKYDRARALQLLAGLDPLGLKRADIVATAGRMRRASEALRARAVSVAAEIARETGGAVIFDRTGFERIERDTQLRLLAAACMWVSGAEYRPRAASLEDLLDRLLAGGAGTLIGAKAETAGNTCRVYRELAAVGSARMPLGALWDGRWQVTGPHGDGLQVAALGEGIGECPDRHASDLPRAMLMATPAVWQGDRLVAAPVAGYNPDWHARIVTPFTTYLLSH